MKKLGFLLAVLMRVSLVVDAKCSVGCDLALASYYITSGDSLSVMSGYFDTTTNDILGYNPSIRNRNSVASGTRVNVPFTCDCINGDFLGHVFDYQIESGDTYTKVAELYYANLTTPSLIQKFNGYSARNLPVRGNLNVTVNCSCGDSSVSTDYGLFITYPLIPGDTLSSIAQTMDLNASLLQKYNPSVDFGAGAGLVFIPGKDKNGSYRPLVSHPSSPGGPPNSPGGPPSSGVSTGIIAGICAAIGLIALLGCWYFGCMRRKRSENALLSYKSEIQLTKEGDVTAQSGGTTAIPGVTIDKSVEFSYAELSDATNNFSLAHKIGEGGFAVVYYGELRGEKTAIKKMDMQATKEFLAELKVLSHIHHLNLVRLIGYCVHRSLFLVYEYIENGTLSQHLHSSDRPLSWTARVQIALDSARGLEYIHEHTVPVYIHRDIKSPNILIDNNFRAKVADFGLTKLVEVGTSSLPTGLQGTFGYMPPEYAQFGEVSPKVDVFAFGVVLYELISGKKAVVRETDPLSQPKPIVSLFEDVFRDSDPTTSICTLVDPRLGEDYPLDSVFKMAELARACTQQQPEHRPIMRSVVVALLLLSSGTDNWDINSFYENGLHNPVSGR